MKNVRPLYPKFPSLMFGEGVLAKSANNRRSLVSPIMNFSTEKKGSMKQILISALMCLLANTTYAEGTTPQPKKHDALIVYGQDFMFSVKEPSGWTGDIENAAKYSSNIIFYPNSQLADKDRAVIRVLIADKTDENVQEDLAHDMSEYRSQYAKVQFKKLSVSHPEYTVFPKLLTVPNEFYEYVTYVNPGPQMKMMFSVSMNKQKKEASASELEAYQKVIASLLMLNKMTANGLTADVR